MPRFGPPDENGRRAHRSRLDHHHPVALPFGGINQAGGGGDRGLNILGTDAAPDLDHVLEAHRSDLGPQGLGVGAIPEDGARQIRYLAAGLSDRRRDQQDPLLWDMASGEDRDRRSYLLRMFGAIVPRRPPVLTSQAHDRRPVTELLKPSLDHFRKREAEVGKQKAELLHLVPEPAADRPEVGAPVRRAPELVPIDEQGRRRSPQAQCEPGPRQREVRKRSRVDRVIPPPVSQQVPEDSPAESDRGENAPATRSGIERPPGCHGDRLERRLRPLGSPLAASQIGDVVLAAEPLGEIPVPPLRPPDRIGYRQS